MTRQIDHTKRRQAGSGRVELQVDAMGNALCRNCLLPVPAGRKTFCSDDCVHNWKMTTSPTYVRGLVLRRDKGVCCVCRWDAESAHKIYLELWHGHCINNQHMSCVPEPELTQWHSMLTKRGIKLPALNFSDSPLALEWVRNWGHGRCRILSFWQADHIQRVAEGHGVQLTIEGLQTLCSQCHHEKTQKQRKELGR